MGLNELARAPRVSTPSPARAAASLPRSDVQPLLNEGARPRTGPCPSSRAWSRRPSRAWPAVTPSGLRGVSRRSPAVLSELRRRFTSRLTSTRSTAWFPPPPPSWRGAAGGRVRQARDLCRGHPLARAAEGRPGARGQRLDPLFATEEDYKEFRSATTRRSCPRVTWPATRSRLHGIDAGSTTAKCAGGRERRASLHLVRQQRRRPGHCATSWTASTTPCPGYHWPARTTTGWRREHPHRALRADSGEIETVAHLRGAKAFVPRRRVHSRHWRPGHAKSSRCAMASSPHIAAL